MLANLNSVCLTMGTASVVPKSSKFYTLFKQFVYRCLSVSDGRAGGRLSLRQSRKVGHFTCRRAKWDNRREVGAKQAGFARARKALRRTERGPSEQIHLIVRKRTESRVFVWCNCRGDRVIVRRFQSEVESYAQLRE